MLGQIDVNKSMQKKEYDEKMDHLCGLGSCSGRVRRNRFQSWSYLRDWMRRERER